MKRLIVFILLLAVAIGVVGYWRGWFIVSNDNHLDVQVNEAKFDKDKHAFSKTVGAKAKDLKEEAAKLWKKTEGLSGDEKAQAQKELTELNTKHDRLERQIKELDESGQDKFEDIKQDLSKNLDDVEKKMKDLAKKLEHSKDK
jgi:predicted transcriptional regulator